MITSKEEAIKCILLSTDKENKSDEKDVEKAFEYLQNVVLEVGLCEGDIDMLVSFLVAERLKTSAYLNIFKCLVPMTTISNDAIRCILEWLYSETLPQAVEKYSLHWLLGVTFYELCDIDIMQYYYHSFLFKMIEKESLDGILCKLLCLLTKPEDAKRWAVKLMLNMQRKKTRKSSINALLSRWKQYRPDVVPENIPATVVAYENSLFNDSLQRAHARHLEAGVSRLHSSEAALCWRPCKVYNGKSKGLRRVIPECETISFESSVVQAEAAGCRYLVQECPTVVSLGTRLLRLSIPAQTMSLLANVAGHHVLAYGDLATQTRFAFTLYYTLRRVFLMDLEPYTETEKSYLLDQVLGMEEYMHQGMAVVGRFLKDYLLMWNGEDFQPQVLGLLSWLDCSEQDLTGTVLPALRLVSRRMTTPDRCRLLRSLSKLACNAVAVSARTARDQPGPFLGQYPEATVVGMVAVVGAAVGRMVVEALNFAPAPGPARLLLTAALDFYEVVQAVEMAGDLPIVVLMPPAVVYGCLLSHSPLCVARLCSLLVSCTSDTKERLTMLGVLEDHVADFQTVSTYLLDCYRCLFAGLDFRPGDESFLLHDKKLREMLAAFHGVYGEDVNRMFCVENCINFSSFENNGLRKSLVGKLHQEYPSLAALQDIVNHHLSNCMD